MSTFRKPLSVTVVVIAGFVSRSFQGRPCVDSHIWLYCVYDSRNQSAQNEKDVIRPFQVPESSPEPFIEAVISLVSRLAANFAKKATLTATISFSHAAPFNALAVVSDKTIAELHAWVVDAAAVFLRRW